MLERVSVHFSSATQSCPTLCDPMDCSPPGSTAYGDSPGKKTGVGYNALLQGIFPTQGPNPGLPHCRWILYHLSHQGSPWILKWVANPFFRGSSLLRNTTGISCIAGRFFTSWATREAWESIVSQKWFFSFPIEITFQKSSKETKSEEMMCLCIKKQFAGSLTWAILSLLITWIF